MKISKDEAEKFLVGEYLAWKKVKVLDLKTLSEFCPDYGRRGISGPDTRARCEINGIIHNIGIELTEYQVRQGAHGSPHARWDAIADQISNRIQQVWVPQYPALKHCLVTFDFDQGSLPVKSNIHAFTDELATFVNDRIPAMNKPHSFRRATVDSHSGCDFAEFPLLRRHLVGLRIVRADCVFLRWGASSADSMGIVRERFFDYIKERADKLRNYDRSSCDPCWLLIAATGSSTDSRIGPPQLAQVLADDQELTDVAKTTNFQRIIVWERIRNWDIDLVSGVVGFRLWADREGVM